jgi:glutamine synthetase
MRLSLDELSGLVRERRIDTVVTAFTDMQGRFMGKRVTGEFFCSDVAEHGIHFCNYLLGTEMEMTCPPGFRLMSWAPWLEKTAFVICDVLDDEGKPVPVAPRALLKQQIAAAQAEGFAAQMASELEFYLLRDTYEAARQKHFHDLEPFGWYFEDYHILQGAKGEPVYRDIRNGMTAAGMPVEFSKGEAGRGQHEVNLRYASALEAADYHALFKEGAKEIAMAHGLALTFMAKPDHTMTGSSCHIHVSLWDPARASNRFHAGSEGHGWSPVMRHFLGGLVAASADFAVFLAPTVNSYKRYAAGSWAPVNLAWAWDNRTCGFRLVGSGTSLRIETRIPGADVNPYLAYTAVLAAGLHGIRTAIEPPPEFRGNAYEASDVARMPEGLPEAARTFRHSVVAREALGDVVVEHYAHAADVEQAEFDKVVTCWERERYLERI